MSPHASFLLLLAALPGLMAAATLDESGGGLQAPGGGLTLPCPVSNSTTLWLRQWRTFHFLAALHQDGGTSFSPALQGRAAILRGGSAARLRVGGLGAGDAGFYFCARAAHGDAGPARG
ncbi:HVM60 protein, partial [Penelope pileata]|nr:HVM60 protein [Penelope pileata]